MTEGSVNINNGEVKGRSEHNQKPVRQGIRWGKQKEHERIFSNRKPKLISWRNTSSLKTTYKFTLHIRTGVHMLTALRVIVCIKTVCLPYSLH